MLLLTISIIILAASIALFVIAENHWDWPDAWGIIGLIGIIFDGMLVIGLLIWLSLLPVSIKSTKADYEVLSVQVEYVRNEGIVTDATLLKKILNMNSTIEHHRVFKDSPWLGWFHSEEIANLQPLKLPPND